MNAPKFKSKRDQDAVKRHTITPGLTSTTRSGWARVRQAGSEGATRGRAAIAPDEVTIADKAGERQPWVDEGPRRRRREPSVEEGSTRIIVDRSGSWRAAWSGNWPGWSLATKAALGSDELAKACGVAERTLQKHFRRFVGRTPSAVRRELRLGQARRELLRAQPQDTVTAIASRFGFNHLARFAGVYHERFGETPSATLRIG